MKSTEYFPLVNDNGEVIGKATRKECHSGTFWLHPVVHLHVFNSNGELYLQKRALNKDIQPDKWDTSVGGHVDYGEEIIIALKREVREELGIFEFKPQFIKSYKFVSSQEAEYINCFYTVYDEQLIPDPIEISEGKFWKIEEIKKAIGKNIFTPNFEQEFLNIILPGFNIFFP
jgi:isopentenyldiphosphate isomerase